MFDMVTPPFGCITVNQIQNRSPAPPKAKRIQCPLFTILGCCWDCCPFIYQHLENPRLALQSGPTISAGKDLRSAYRPIARASLVAQWLKKKKKKKSACNAGEFVVQSLGQEDPLEEEMATHSSTLAWRTPWTEEPGWATVYGVTKSQTQVTWPSLYWDTGRETSRGADGVFYGQIKHGKQNQQNQHLLKHVWGS